MKRTFAALAALLLGSATLTQANAEVTYVTADAMVDVLSGKTVQNAVVRIENGRITAAGTTSDIDVPSGANVINLNGATLTPGMIDMHVHLLSNSDVHGYKRVGRLPQRSTIDGVVHAETTLMAGITTVRNVGTGSYASIALRDAIADGQVPGPRMFVAGPPVGITGGHCSDGNLLPVEYESISKGMGVADGPWAVRAAVRRNVKYGVDLIKTCSTGGVLSKGTKVGAPQYTVEELTALVDEAHMHGRKVASHAHGTEGIKNALKAGVDTIEHASFIDAEGIKLAKKNGAYLSMDIYVTEFILGEGEAAGILQESLDKERMTGTVQRENFEKAVKAGAKIILGTDAGVYPHGDNPKQLSRMVQFGMTPLQALQAATSVAGEALGKAGEIGAIAPGYEADIIAVMENPLDNIAALENVVFVMKSGSVYKQPE